MRRSFRRRGRRATWGYANEDLMQASAGSSTTSYTWLLPPGRTNFLCDTDRVPAITYMGTHMWLDFDWVNTNASAQSLCDVTFYVIVSQQAPQADSPAETDNIPWGAPQLPSAISSWDEHEEDGTESFLWIHHIKGNTPPNSIIRPLSNSGLAVINQNTFIDGGSSDQPSYVCRIFDVRAAWQPDVIIKSRRRVWKDEGVALVMRTDSIPAPGVTVNCAVRYRTLIKRGR